MGRVRLGGLPMTPSRLSHPPGGVEPRAAYRSRNRAATGPQEFLRQVLHQVDDDETIAAFRKIGSQAMRNLDGGLSKFLPLFDNAQRKAFPILWDIGGVPKAETYLPARGILQDYYGFTEKSARVIAQRGRLP